MTVAVNTFPFLALFFLRFRPRRVHGPCCFDGPGGGGSCGGRRKGRPAQSADQCNCPTDADHGLFLVVSSASLGAMTASVCEVHYTVRCRACTPAMIRCST